MFATIGQGNEQVVNEWSKRRSRASDAVHEIFSGAVIHDPVGDFRPPICMDQTDSRDNSFMIYIANANQERTITIQRSTKDLQAGKIDKFFGLDKKQEDIVSLLFNHDKVTVVLHTEEAREAEARIRKALQETGFTVA